MKKILILLLFFLMNLLNADAKSQTCDLMSVINSSGANKNSVSVSIKDLDSRKIVYELNEDVLMHPASIQKLLTIIPAVEVLGNDYEYTTELYSRGDGKYLIKLGGDPYLVNSDLKSLVKNISQEAELLYIDDSILEKKDWGEGWQWDDDLNPYMPRFNSYNLDRNAVKITLMPSKSGEAAQIINQSRYPFVFMNNVITQDKNDIKVERDNSVSSNVLSLSGTINKPEVVSVNVNNLKRHFEIKLKNDLADRNIYLRSNFIPSELKDSDKKIGSVSHTISEGVDDILKNSNNMASEITSKLAGGKMFSDKGTDLYGIKVFQDYCKKNGLDTSRIKLTDASGVSKNNLLTADFVTEFLLLNKDNKILDSLPKPGEGTLTNRLLPIKDNVRAKTGTHSDVSSLAGFLTSRSGHRYAFCIIINDTELSTSNKKTLEDYLIREAFLRL